MFQTLRDAVADEHDLEVALIYSVRVLGFVANHISGAGEPDGLARFVDYPNGERRIILEAKASVAVPTLHAIDFIGLHSHMKSQKYDAEGCLLLAPSYPGNSKEDSEAAQRAKNLGISCWTVEQLALRPRPRAGDLLPVQDRLSYDLLSVRAALLFRIYGDSMFREYASRVNPPIHIIVERGRVALTGAVPSEVEKRKAEHIARSTFGVFAVENRLQVGS